MIYSILVGVQVVVALTLIGIILVQHGKGADAGAAFGSGASGTVFGAKGSANFLTHATAVLAVVFFAISLSLAYLVNDTSAPTGSVTDKMQQHPPGSSLITDKNNNGVSGDEVITGGKPTPAGGGSAKKRPSQGNAKGAAATTGQKSDATAGKQGAGGDTGAKIPE